MPADLSWLSDECIPLFFAFMGLQLLHETAHVAMAKSKNVSMHLIQMSTQNHQSLLLTPANVSCFKFEVTVPTLIPSIISGITGSITSLKTSPKNKSDLLLFSVAGPLTGILASLLLEAYGLALTASADLQTLQSFPGLPLALLRQSSLGGGLIDLVLGNGVLNVPSSIEGANLLASTVIQLHPFAIAGFVSLLVNALALVPAGRTDGGRISMSLFGRSGSQGLTLVSLGALFLVGITGSDLLLFYFGFVVLAQLELEIPLRNEIDDVGLPEVLLAALAGFLTVLTLVPM
jgi:membrane-associated protease RseP (regulator of RpoE activity)